MTESAKKRGRPRSFDPDAVLESARDVFWKGGFAASSLDDLAAAMSMNRPSLYAAFGDKEALYLKTLERYRDESLDSLRLALDPTRPLAEGLRAVYAKALSVYLGDERALGCLLLGTAAAEAVLNPKVRDVLGGSLAAFDQAFQARFATARDSGEIDGGTDVEILARLTSAVMHSLAVRSRARDDRETLEALAEAGVVMISRMCQPADRSS